MSLHPESGQMKATASRALDGQIIAAWPRLDLLALEVGISRHRLAQRLVALTRDPEAHMRWPELARITRVLSLRRDERARGLVHHGGL